MRCRGTLVLALVTDRLFRWREFISIIFLGLDTATQLSARNVDVLIYRARLGKGGSL
jgi:hypothetical protein